MHHDVRIFPIRIRHDEPVVPVRQRPQHGNVGDTRGECAAYTEDLLEHHVGYLVARETQSGFVRADLVSQQPLASEDIIKLERNVVAVLPQRLNLSDHHIIVAEPAPIIEGDAGTGVRLLDHVLAIRGLEAPAAGQIVAHEARHVE